MEHYGKSSLCPLKYYIGGSGNSGTPEGAGTEQERAVFHVCGNGWCPAPKNKGGKSVVTWTFLTASLLG